MKIIAKNKNAFYKYTIIKSYEAGIELQGSEVKSIANNKVNITEAYINFMHNEAFLINAHIGKNQDGNYFDHEPLRTRKLLLHKKEIEKLILEKNKQALTVIPIKMYFINSLVKIEIGLARGKTNLDIKDTIKRRDLDMLAKKDLKKYR